MDELQRGDEIEDHLELMKRRCTRPIGAQSLWAELGVGACIINESGPREFAYVHDTYRFCPATHAPHEHASRPSQAVARNNSPEPGKLRSSASFVESGVARYSCIICSGDVYRHGVRGMERSYFIFPLRLSHRHTGVGVDPLGHPRRIGRLAPVAAGAPSRRAP